MREELRSLGLTEREADAYLALYQFRETTATQLAKITKEHRTNIYDSLHGLIKKGLITYNLKNNVKYYSVSDPENLLELIKEKEKIAKDILPKLKLKLSTIEVKPIVQIYEGPEGFKSILSKIIREAKTTYAIGASVEWEKRFPIRFEQYVKEREKKKIYAKLLYVKKAKPKLSVSPVNEIRFLPIEHSQPSTIAIFGDYVAIFMWTEPMIATLTKSKSLANSFKQYFKVLWKISKK